ncbi:hypothetical protein P154DRAFT_566996 [Amniculicola lignicola CBS 123094]|uniref:Uncharacterized protein n=1 Tax=Amniculicola lignicola CBS 123094 TaxID=1392246 RepID=A0A6A5VZV5_9PLEO|nr:hypothetical protein P154DRAFT_566996 [Amniculicola lignicola CBS 123094]
MADVKLPSSPTLPTTPKKDEYVSNSDPSSIRSAMSIDNILTPGTGGADADLPALPVTPTRAAHSSDYANFAADTKSLSPTQATSSPGGFDNSSVYAEGLKIDEDEGTEAAAFIPLDEREFICMNDEHSHCQTGQVTLSLSRKVISDHFGRNKACTRAITDWPLFCRKHYQRATYKPDLWQVRKIDLIARQLDIIEAQFPGTTYQVCLKKAEESRLNEFARKIAGGMSLAEASALVAPKDSVKSFQAPINVLRQLEFSLGNGKTLDEVKSTVALILDMLRLKETSQVPSIEFLPGIPLLATTVASAPSTPVHQAVQLAMKQSQASSSRVSPKKGSVQKIRK